MVLMLTEISHQAFQVLQRQMLVHHSEQLQAVAPVAEVLLVVAQVPMVQPLLVAAEMTKVLVKNLADYLTSLNLLWEICSKAKLAIRVVLMA